MYPHFHAKINMKLISQIEYVTDGLKNRFSLELVGNERDEHPMA